MPPKRSDLEPLAFQFWATDGNRSVKDTADKFGVPLRTVYYWKDTYRWDFRWKELVQPLVARAVDTAKLQVKLGLTDASKRLVTIVRRGSDRDAVLAARLLWEMALSDADSRVTSKHLTLVDARTLTVGDDAQPFSLDDVRRHVSGYIARTVESNSVDTKRRT